VQIETCPHCGGIWLDAGELQLLAHEHRRALLTQLIADGFEALQSGKKPGATA
jgi:Zn-finger nucleic acid-binding protein